MESVRVPVLLKSWTSEARESSVRFVLESTRVACRRAVPIDSVSAADWRYLSRLSCPLAADAAAESHPPERKVSDLVYGRIYRDNLLEVNDSTVSWVICRSTQELPTSIVSIMGYHQDQGP